MNESADNQTWKRATRLACIERRTKLPERLQRDHAAAINAHLNAGVVDALAGLVVGFCWPYKSEFDIRFAIRKIREHGSRTALPKVVKKAHPLEFHEWWPGVSMVPGVYDIPVPDGTSRLLPDALFVPMNAFDDDGFRLGYGGGFFDRTLASISPQPIAIAIAYEEFRLPTIRPNQYDLPMDIIVTEAGLYSRSGGRLRSIEPAACLRELSRLVQERSFPRRQPESDDKVSEIGN